MRVGTDETLAIEASSGLSSMSTLPKVMSSRASAAASKTGAN